MRKHPAGAFVFEKSTFLEFGDMPILEKLQCSLDLVRLGSSGYVFVRIWYAFVGAEASIDGGIDEA